MNRLQPYPAMKDSGVEWLGEVPEHWGVRRLKTNVSNVVDQTTDQGVDECYVALEHVESWTGRIRDAGSDASFDSQVRRFKTGDVLFGKLRPYLAKVARPERDGVCVGEFLVLRARNGEQTAAYLEQLLRSQPIINVISASTFGAKMPRTDWTFMGTLELLIPSLSEQAAIVRYLDYVDRRVWRLVRAKRKLIELLTEQKQVIIHRAVTRGLDPDGPLKDSGVEWLGKVPEHWEVRRVKTLFRLRIEKSGTNHGRELLSIYTHIGVRPRKDLEEKGNKASTTDDYWIVQNGDIICNKLLAWMGAIGVSHFEGVTSPAYDILMPLVELSPDYYHHLFRTKHCLQEFKQRSRGIMDMRLRLYFDQFGTIRVTFPPPDEQRAIVEYYKQATADIDTAITRANREIDLLNEYRTRLIADIVTGKLDVRNAAATLPEIDPLDTEDVLGDLDTIPAEAEL